jgi:hypothetical protein
MIPMFEKQPNDNLDYDVEMASFLPTSDFPLSVVKSVTPAGPTLGTTNINATTKVLKQWISGGTSGNTYKVTLDITTNEGRIKQVDFNLKVKDR